MDTKIKKLWKLSELLIVHEISDKSVRNNFFDDLKKLKLVDSDCKILW